MNRAITTIKKEMKDGLLSLTIGGLILLGGYVINWYKNFREERNNIYSGFDNLNNEPLIRERANYIENRMRLYEYLNRKSDTEQKFVKSIIKKRYDLIHECITKVTKEKYMFYDYEKMKRVNESFVQLFIELGV